MNAHGSESADQQTPVATKGMFEPGNPAWMHDADELWQALAPSVTASSEHRISVVSTPRGKGGLFHRLWTEADRSCWRRHRVNVDDAIAGGCPIDREALRLAIGDELTWRACYECEFVDEQYALLSYKLLMACVDPALPYRASLPDLAKAGDLYVGMDIGRRRDLTFFAFLELTDTQLVCRGLIELDGAPFDEQEGLLNDIMTLSNVRYCVIDSTGLGMQLAERAWYRWGERITTHTLTHAVKEELCGRMAGVFHRGEIRIPDDPTLLADLHSMERSVSAAGNLRYTTTPRSQGHADRFMAIALALCTCDYHLRVCDNPITDICTTPVFI